MLLKLPGCPCPTTGTGHLRVRGTEEVSRRRGRVRRTGGERDGAPGKQKHPCFVQNTPVKNVSCLPTKTLLIMKAMTANRMSEKAA